MSRYYRRYRYRKYRSDDEAGELIAVIIVIFAWCIKLIFRVVVFIIKKIVGLISRTEQARLPETIEPRAVEMQSLAQEVLEIEPREKLPYQKKEYLLTITENKFYKVLKRVAEENNCRINTKVRLEDLLEVSRNMDYGTRYGFRNRIKSRHIDFVLCDQRGIQPLLAIELDDYSHNRWDRKRRDEFVDQALRDAGLPILHIPVQNFYYPNEIRELIRNSLRRT
jgi:Protein of unknown function (DUF2726)